MRTRPFTLQPCHAVLRALLDARPVCREPTALVSPCDGTIDAAGPAEILVRATTGRLHRLRSRRRYVIVRAGDRVAAGEALTGGERSHHALLHAWGAERLASHLVDELALVLGPAVPRVYLALVVRAMLTTSGTGHPILRGIARAATTPRSP